jgi:hypothetical protein
LIKRQNNVLAGKAIVKEVSVVLVLYDAADTKLQFLASIDWVESIQFVADLGQTRVSVCLSYLTVRAGMDDGFF